MQSKCRTKIAPLRRQTFKLWSGAGSLARMPSTNCSGIITAKEFNLTFILYFRPVNSKEVDEGQQTIVRVDERLRQIEISSKNNKPIKAFQFDNAFGPSSTQRDIYSSTITPIGSLVLSAKIFVVAAV